MVDGLLSLDLLAQFADLVKRLGCPAGILELIHDPLIIDLGRFILFIFLVKLGDMEIAFRFFVAQPLDLLFGLLGKFRVGIMFDEFLEFLDRGLRDLLVVLSVGGTLAVRDGDLIFGGPGPLARGNRSSPSQIHPSPPDTNHFPGNIIRSCSAMAPPDCRKERS